MLAEGLILAAGGAVVGLALTAAALPLLQAYTPVAIPRLADAAVDVRTVAAALAVIVGATMFFALVPALASLKRHLTTELKSGERGSSRGARRLYSVLVGAELALACGLLVGSALLVRTVQRMTETPTGVDAVDVATTTVQIVAGARRARQRHPRPLACDRGAARAPSSRRCAASPACRRPAPPTSCRSRSAGATRS